MNIHANRLSAQVAQPLTRVKPELLVVPQPELNEHISCDMYETIDLKFEECMELYISESGMRDEYEDTTQDFLESFTFEQKVAKILSHLEVELACTRTTLKYLNDKNRK